MSISRLVRFSIHALASAAMLLGLAGPAGRARPALADHTTNPASVTVPGSHNSEIGCSGDWQADCAAAHLAYDSGDDVWQGSWSIPAGSFEYKAALNDSWDENYGQNAQPGGANIPLNLGATTTVKFYYDHKSHWITSNQNAVIATVPGSFQSELGCPGDWQPECLRSWLQDADGDGTYAFETTALPAGSYEAKVAINESWDENYGEGGVQNGANIPFTVAVTGQKVTFSYNPVSHVLTITPESTGAGQDNNIFWDDLGHNSRDSLYRTPQGPVTAGTPVTLRLRAASNDLTGAQVRVWNDRLNIQSLIAMERVADDGTYEWWQATVPASADPTIYWYRFIATDGTATAYYEDDNARTGGWGQTIGASVDNSWQLTVYDPAFQTPDWVKNGVMYQIFPDRFRDGNSGNNTPAGSFFYNEAGGTIVRSNQADWNRYVCDPRDANDCPGTYSKNFYGGDLQGILDKLDYLQDLGVTVLYLNPIFESPSNHKYDTTDYAVVDDNFGDLALFQTLAAEAQNRGIHIVLDGVFNHTSSDSIYFDRYARYTSLGACESESSTYRAWYYFQPAASPGTGVCAGDTNYTSWFGFDSLPKLNAANSDARGLIWAGGPAAIARYWLEQGADGWRLDVGGDVDPGVTNDLANDYWEGFRSAVHQSMPDAYIVGEEWNVATAWTLGPEWDATMNYQFSSAILSFWRDTAFSDNDHNSGSSAGVLNPLGPSGLDERLHNLAERYPPEALYAMMNLLGSHDTNRALFMLDHNTGQNDPALYENPNYDWSDAITRLKGVALLQMTLPGAPTIYYGDEVGLVGPVGFDGSQWQDDPYNRQPFPWLDQTGTPFYAHLQSQASQDSLRDYYKLLTGARNTHAALRTGSFDTLLTDDTNNVYAFGRKLADHSDAAVVIANRSGSAQAVSLNVAGYLPYGAQFQNVLDGALYSVDGSGYLTVPSVPARSGAVLVLYAPMAAAPAAVTDLAVTDERSAEIDLAWSAASGATSYDIYRGLVSGGYAFVANTSGTTFTDSGLTNATRYYYVVVSRTDANGLLSGSSNEASGVPQHDLTTAWFNLQWPYEIFHTISTSNPTENIYGQLWIGGATEAPGPASGISAQVGFGPPGSQPTEPSWQWTDMTFNVQAGNNDEYVGSLLPDMLGDFDYTTRYSSDGGETWFYADRDGPGYDAGRGGLLHVLASGDTAAPGAPAGLQVDSTTSSDISLSWTANTESDLAGYELYRQDTAAPGFSRIASLAATATSYTDPTVTTGQTYDYYLLAFDTSFNRSGPSNTVQATAEPRLVDVTFNVTVPSFTPGTVYIVGSLPEFGPWNPGLVPMTQVDATHWTYSLSILDGTLVEYKFTRGNWETVEKEADGNTEIPNRQLTVDYGTSGTQTVDLTVANWRDPIVVSHSPAAGASNVAVSSTVSVTWSQAMPATTDFTLTGPAGVVAGTFAYDSGSNTVTFTPASNLQAGAVYTASVTGESDTAGDVQQSPKTWSFTTLPDTPPTVQFSSAAYSVSEGVGTASVTLTLSHPSTQPVTVTAKARNGTARAQKDFQITTTKLTFPPGVTEQTFTFVIYEDTQVEPDEDVRLSLSGPVNATLGTPSSSTLTIVDND